MVLVTPAGAPDTVSVTAPVKFTLAAVATICIEPPCGSEVFAGLIASVSVPVGLGLGLGFGPVPEFDDPPPHPASMRKTADAVNS